LAQAQALRPTHFARGSAFCYSLPWPGNRAALAVDARSGYRSMTTLPMVVTVSAGDGGIDELREAIDKNDALVQWALVKFSVGGGTLRRKKLLFLHVNGANCPAVARGRANSYENQVKDLLCSSCDLGNFHASLEVTHRSEVTAAQLLERASQKAQLVTDEATYSVEWHIREYERQIDAEKAEAAKIAEKRTRVQLCPGHISEQLFRTGRDALRGVADTFGPWNWLLLGPEADSLPLLGGGDGSFEEMRECIAAHPSQVAFGVLRMGFGVGRLRRTKHIFVHVVGPGVPAVRRGQENARRPQIEAAVKDFLTPPVDIEVFGVADFTLEALIGRVRKAAVVDDDVLKPDAGTKGAYTMEAFREALREERSVLLPGLAQAQKESCYRDMPVEDVVRLVSAPLGPLNWALFNMNEVFTASRRSRSSPSRCLLLRPGKPVGLCLPAAAAPAPLGGFLRAAKEARPEEADARRRYSSMSPRSLKLVADAEFSQEDASLISEQDGPGAWDPKSFIGAASQMGNEMPKTGTTITPREVQPAELLDEKADLENAVDGQTQDNASAALDVPAKMELNGLRLPFDRDQAAPLVQSAWMWRDAGRYGGSATHYLAHKNPLRWSRRLCLTETISDLRQFLGTANEERPVKVKLYVAHRAKATPTTVKAPNVVEAIFALKGMRGAREFTQPE